MPARRNTPHDFWSRVNIGNTGECWEWTMSRRSGRYGQAHYGNKNWFAHRLAWTLVHGDIPDGLLVCHACDNVLCCNPAHLFLGTGADNSADRNAKLRQYRGFGHHHAKLNEEQVLEIKRTYVPRHPEFGQAALSRKFGVSQPAIYSVLKGESYAYVHD